MEEPERATTASDGANLIEMPAPTAWPIILAFGVMLSFASLVTNAGIGIAGFALVICGCVGWFLWERVVEHQVLNE